jgi:hypothetical protein
LRYLAAKHGIACRGTRINSHEDFWSHGYVILCASANFEAREVNDWREGNVRKAANKVPDEAKCGAMTASIQSWDYFLR